jgi:hypothetical protein
MTPTGAGNLPDHPPEASLPGGKSAARRPVEPPVTGPPSLRWYRRYRRHHRLACREVVWEICRQARATGLRGLV